MGLNGGGLAGELPASTTFLLHLSFHPAPSLLASTQAQSAAFGSWSALLFLVAMSLPRRAIVAVLVLLLASSATPSAALLLCMSADGHASIEFAAPGTVRCADTDCEEGAIGLDDHSCRDIPVLSVGQLTLRSSPEGVAQSAALPAANHALAPRPAKLAKGPVDLIGAPATARALRSVVLTL